MAKYELVMPKMGESIIEATILNWLKKPGDSVQEDETILEIATDKVDSEIPSPVDGVIAEILHQVDETVAVGKTIAIIETEGIQSASEESSPSTSASATEPQTKPEVPFVPQGQNSNNTTPAHQEISRTITASSGEEIFLSPLVRNIAKTENVSASELAAINGSGQNNRITKNDILEYIRTRGASAPVTSPSQHAVQTSSISSQSMATPAQAGPNEEIIEMDRMRKVIAQHMVNSKATSPHVTSMVEADVTHIVQWRNKVKKQYQEKYGEKITYTPLLMEAVVKAIQDFPMINISVQGDHIIKKNNINLGMATALPNGNLIVPVIKNANHLNLVGLTQAVNDLANRARNGQLKPGDIQGGTYTVTNVGTFGNVMGTPIINQPQVAILAMGAIRKKPAVLETEAGDVIAIRHMMFLSHSYDHRVVDGYLGGSFVRRVADYLESFDLNREI